MHFHDVLETQKDTIKHDTFEARCFPVTTPLFWGLSQYMKRPPPPVEGVLGGLVGGWLG